MYEIKLSMVNYDLIILRNSINCSHGQLRSQQRSNLCQRVCQELIIKLWDEICNSMDYAFVHQSSVYYGNFRLSCEFVRVTNGRSHLIPQNRKMTIQ